VRPTADDDAVVTGTAAVVFSGSCPCNSWSGFSMSKSAPVLLPFSGSSESDFRSVSAPARPGAVLVVVLAVVVLPAAESGGADGKCNRLNIIFRSVAVTQSWSTGLLSKSMALGRPSSVLNATRDADDPAPLNRCESVHRASCSLALVMIIRLGRPYTLRHCPE